MMTEALVTHNPMEIAITILLLSQMAMLEGPMSTYFGKSVTTRKRRGLTREVRSIANRCKGLSKKRSRIGTRKPGVTKCFFISDGVGRLRGIYSPKVK
jgi:hypothetical protein